MAKRIKQYSEAELIDTFKLIRLVSHQCSTQMQTWLDCETTLNDGEQYLFDLIFNDACQNIGGWHEYDALELCHSGDKNQFLLLVAQQVKDSMKRLIKIAKGV
jgi:hypothetical protein